jgi:hypothetical protein
MQKIHEYGGFKVDKNELSKLFYIIYNNPNLKNKELEYESGFGKNKVENLKYYLKNFNLIGKEYKPTELAKVIYTYDKYFEDEVTLWILFFHWAQKTSNPFLFYQLNESVGAKSVDELKEDFCSWAVHNNIKTDYEKPYVRGLILRTVNSYTDSDAFKSLNVFTFRNEIYNRDIPFKINPLLLAYVLFENKEGRTTISFEELLKEPNNIGKIFNLNRESLQQCIYEMRDAGLVQYVQTANLQYVTYVYHGGSIKLLEQYYEQY